MNFNPKDFKDPLNLLTLVGFICQGLAWEDAAMPFLFAGLWCLCIMVKRNKHLISEHMELLFFMLAFLLSLIYGGQGGGTRFSYYYTKTMSVGNSLLVLQAMRLLRPISKREKLFSCAMSITLLAIGSHFMVDYPFILILAAALILIPKALNHTMQEGRNHFRPFRLMENRGSYILLVILMAAFFVVFPRRRIYATPGMNVLMSARGAIQPELDATFGGAESADSVLFRIEGKDLGYLKSYSLDEFDGAQWKASRWSSQARPARRGIPLSSCKHRKVNVNDVKSLGSSLPVDGYVVAIRGNFFQGAYVRVQDSVGITSFWPGSNNEYEYWTKDDQSDPPAKNELERCLAFPEQSAALRKWLDEAVGREKDPGGVARRIEKALKDGCMYELGAPGISSPAPVEEFVLKEKKGHCGRFASAAALLLRMSGVPSRVGIGFLPGEKNQFADFHNVRGGDAHAWAEAYIKGRGWVIVDATPAAQNRAGAGAGSLALSARDWLEYIWYSKIVNFSLSDQQSMLAIAAETVAEAKNSIPGNLGVILFCALILALGIITFRARRKIAALLSAVRKDQSSSMEATHFYGAMLRLLAKEKLLRDNAETPFEFLSRLEKGAYPRSPQVRTLTEIFCEVKYGGRVIRQSERPQIRRALREIRSNRIHPSIRPGG